MLERKTKARLRVNKLTLPLQGNIASCTAGMCFLGGKNLFPPEGANGAWSGGRWGRVGQVLTC